MGGNDDGTIVIGTKVNTSGIEEGVTEIERQTDKVKDIKVNVDVTVGDILEDSGIIEELDTLMARYKELTTGPVLFESDRQEAEIVKQQILEIVDKVEQLTGEHLIIKGINDVKNELPDIKNKVESIGNSLEKMGRKVSRLGLQLLGLRSIYGMISSSISRVTKENVEIQTSIEAINSVIDGIIGKLLELLLPVLNLIAGALRYIAEDLLGIDVSAYKFTKDMKKANNTVSKLRKQLLGFDEMNILNDDGTTGVLGSLVSGTSGGTGPGGNNKTEDITDEIKDKIKRSVNYGVEVFEETNDELQDGVNNVMDILTTGSIYRFLGIWQPTGSIQLTAKYKPYFDSIKRFINDSMVEIKDGWVTIEHEGVDTIKMTTVEYEAMLKAMNKGTVTSTLQASQFDKVLGEIEKWNKSGPKRVQKKVGGSIANIATEFADQIEEKTGEPLDKAFKQLLDKGTKYTKEQMEGAVITYENGLYTIKTKTGETYTLTKKQYDALFNDIFKNINTFKSAGEQAANSIQNSITTTSNTVSTLTKKQIKEVEDNSKTASKNIASNIETSIKALGNLGKSTVQIAGEGAVGVADSIRDQIAKITGEDLPNDVDKGLGFVTKKLSEWAIPETAFSSNLQKIGNSAGTSVAKGIAGGVNSVIGKMESTLNSSVNAINKLQQDLASKAVMGAYAIASQVNKLTKVSLPRIKLAKGGIINQPGRGVAVGGERGAEWVQPLTDEQALDRVADAIGRRIVLQPTIPVYVGNRMVAREIRKINAEDDFAFNGGVA